MSFLCRIFIVLTIGCCVLNAATVSKEWTVFGPYSSLEHVLPAPLAKGIPESLRAARVPRKAIKVKPVNGKVDMQKIYGKKYTRKSFYICIPIVSAKGEKFRFGAGADWWMDIYLNGESVGDTLADGNVVHPPSGSDHVFNVDLRPGTNYLVIGLIGGVGSQQLIFSENPKVNPAVKKVKSDIQFGSERLPAVTEIMTKWQNGPGAKSFGAKEVSLKNGMLKINAKNLPGKSKRFITKVQLEPGQQYCFSWSSLSRKGELPRFILQDKPDGGKIIFAKEMKNGRNRTGYFYSESPELYAVLEVHGSSVAEINKLSLRRRIDRAAAFQDWRVQRAPVADDLMSLSRELKTPHFDHAPVLAGGALKVFNIGAFWLQRDIVEMEQRFDFKIDNVFTDGYAGGFTSYWARNAQGEVVIKNFADGLKRISNAECILIDHCGASSLTPPVVKKIMDEVKRGAGLVICTFDQPYYPYKDGRGAAAEAKMRKLFAAALDNKVSEDIDFVRISAAGKLNAEFGSYGKGRVVMLKNADKVKNSDVNSVKGKNRINFEIRSALIAKALLWAGRRIPAVRVCANAKDGVISANVSGKVSGKGEISMIAADMECREKMNENIPLVAGVQNFSKKVDEFGRYPVIVTSKLNGVSQDWDIVFADKKSTNIIKKVTIGTHAPMVRCFVELNRKPAKGEMLDITVVDHNGRQWVYKRQYAYQQKNTVYIKADNFPVVTATLTAKLLARDEKVLDQQQTRVVLYRPDNPAEPNFNLGVWGAPIDHYACKLFYSFMRDKYKLNFRLSGNGNANAWDAADLGIIAGPEGFSGQIYFGQNNTVIGPENAPERQLCLSSAKLKKLLLSRIKLLCPQQKGMPVKYFFSDHETNLLGYIKKAKPGSDYCFSPTCRASLVELMKKDYGTLDKLNAAWNTNFSKWEDVTPIVLNSAIKTGHAARWIDHRRNMDKVWADLSTFRINAIRKYHPNAINYVQNLHSGYSSNDSFSGIDFEQLFTREVAAGAMPESYINAFVKPENRSGNSMGGSMWPTRGGLVDNPELSSVRSSRVVWQAMLLGQSNVLYYQHSWGSHRELLFHDQFLFNPDLTMPQEGKALADAVVLAKKGIDRLLLGSEVDDSGISMLYSRSSEHACTYWQACNKEKAPAILNPRYQQFEFFVPAIDDSGRGFSSTGSTLIQKGMLTKKGTKLLILPFAQSISVRDAEIIREFVRNGGTVLADFRPAVTDQHGVFGKAGLLDDVFGIKQDLDWKFNVKRSAAVINYPGCGELKLKSALVGDGFKVVSAKAKGYAKDKTPVMLENTFGKGRAILLNFTTKEVEFRPFFGKVLTALGIPELFGCRDVERRWFSDKGVVKEADIRRDKVAETDDRDKSETEDAGERETLVYESASFPRRHRVVNGPVEIIGYYACRRGFSLGYGEMELEYSVRNPGHVYDLLNGKYLGKTAKWRAVMPLEAVGLYAVLPFKATAPQVSNITVKKNNVTKYHDVSVDIAVDKAAAAVNYPVYVEFVDPAGQVWSELSRTISVKGAAARAEFILPVNAPAGKWSIRVREVFGGETSVTEFTL